MPILSGARPARLPAISLLSKFRARGRVRSRELINAGEMRLCGYRRSVGDVFNILEHTENFSDMACSVNRSLRCPICRGALVSARSPEFALGCLKCNEIYPIVNGIPRMISKAMRQALDDENPPEKLERIDRMRVKTARSFGFEWSRFPEMRAEWESNFWDYMLPHTPESFRGKRVLDAGCGAGRGGFERDRRTDADETIRQAPVSCLRQRSIRPVGGADRGPLQARRS